MKIINTFLLTCILVISVSVGKAQTAETIINKAITALGGEAKLKTLKDSYMEVNMDIMGMNMVSKTWVIYNTGVRTEVDIMGQKIITYIDTAKGWMVNPLMGSTTPQPLPEDAIKSSKGNFSPGRELSSYKADGYKASLEGSEEVNGKKAHKIKLEKDGSSNYIFIDDATNHLVKSVVSTEANGTTIEVVTSFSDYKKTPEGYVFPYSMIISNPMTGDAKATVVKLEVNKKLNLNELSKTE